MATVRVIHEALDFVQRIERFGKLIGRTEFLPIVQFEDFQCQVKSSPDVTIERYCLVCASLVTAHLAMKPVDEPREATIAYLASLATACGDRLSEITWPIYVEANENWPVDAPKFADVRAHATWHGSQITKFGMRFYELLPHTNAFNLTLFGVLSASVAESRGKDYIESPGWAVTHYLANSLAESHLAECNHKRAAFQHSG